MHVIKVTIQVTHPFPHAGEPSLPILCVDLIYRISQNPGLVGGKLTTVLVNGETTYFSYNIAMSTKHHRARSLVQFH